MALISLGRIWRGQVCLVARRERTVKLGKRDAVRSVLAKQGKSLLVGFEEGGRNKMAEVVKPVCSEKVYEALMDDEGKEMNRK